MSAPSPTDHTDYTHHPGVRHTKSGKWGAAIRHPITKVSLWLGSYNTPKEAADAYIKKKLEFSSVVADVTIPKAENALARKSCEAKVMDDAEINSKQSKFDVTETLKASSVETGSLNTTDAASQLRRSHGSGSVYQSNAGRWRAQVSIRKAKVYLGTYTTREEAEATLHKKRQELVSMSPSVAAVVAKESGPECSSKRARKPKKAISESMDGRVTCDSSDAANPVRRSPGSGSIFQNKAGRWRAQTCIRKVKACVGTFTTREEAEAAIRKRKLDLDSMSPFEPAVVKESDPECASKRTRKSKEAISESMDGQVTCNRPLGVFQRESGRWFAEIKNPVTKVRHSVGTYETAQEALEALDRKRREYAEMKKRKQSNAETELVSECQDVVHEAGISKIEDADTNGDRGGGSQVNVCSILAPCSSFVSNQVDEFDTSSVINAYGELVGEFSRMDDELWFG